MSKFATTEIPSAEIRSDNPLHQRFFSPYVEVAKHVSGKVLELGCGWGRGVDTLIQACDHYTGLDKNEPLINSLQAKYPKHIFQVADLPHLTKLKDNTFDFVVTFQVIEHIQDDNKFLSEAHRVLKPGGIIFLTTVNRAYSLSRNPWHIREYSATELKALMEKYFPKVEAKGVQGSEKVWAYHAENKASVDKIMRWDVLDLQHRLPGWMLQTPYEILNRFNRNNLMAAPGSLAAKIRCSDYFVGDDAEKCLDFFYSGTKP
jgi:ubiquinone/menaquinone biosynthesis C-methylase UbiE